MHEGPLHDGMYQPTSMKHKRATYETCSSYQDDTFFNGMSPSDGNITINLNIYKDTMYYHMIENRMYDKFVVKDPLSYGDIDTP